MFRVLRSSAGAGKTHSLVKHYLEACLRTDDPAAYRRVLALTFTNKAAAEMKARVIDYLECLAGGGSQDAAMNDVAAHLRATTGAGDERITARAAAVLEHMLHHWGDAAISTIDSFTRRVVRPFARELRLHNDLRMTTEESWYRDRAVDDLLAKAGTDSTVTEILTATIAQLLDDEEAWDPGAPLQRLSLQLGKEDAMPALAALRETDIRTVIGIIERLRNVNEEFRGRLQELGASALRLIENEGLSGSDLNRGASGFHGFLTKLAAFGTDWCTPNAYVVKVLDKDDWGSGYIAPDAASRLAGITPALRGSVSRGMSMLEEGQAAYFTRRAVLRQLPAAFTLSELGRCLEQRKQDDGVAFFSDLTRLVSELVKDEPAHYIHERLGERYQHYLIDEFQDTSLLQWSTLLPLITNALASGGSALLVGDAKQAIYRWRNGEARLFQSLPNLFGMASSLQRSEHEKALIRHHAPIAPLADNHRSAPEIIAFNNALFSALQANLSPSLKSVYDHHEQRPFKKAPGLVHLECLDASITGDAAKDRKAEFLLNCIQEAISDGFAPGDIAVLVRSNSVGQAMAHALVTAGYRITSPDGLHLGGDVVTETIIDLLRVLDKADAAAASRVMQRMAQLQAPNGALTVDPFGGSEAVIDPLSVVRALLRTDGIESVRTTLSALVADLLRIIGTDPGMDARALALIDEAHAFAKDHGQTVSGFLQHWERKGSDRSLSPPPDRDAIQVMTIHKSKGLEFPVVIMPSTRMAVPQRDLLWATSTEAITGLPYALVKPDAKLANAGIPEMTEEEDLAMMDNVNLLYVAFTRPVQRLYAMPSASRADKVTTGLLQWMESNGGGPTWTSGPRTHPWRDAPQSRAEMLKPVATCTERFQPRMKRDASANWDPYHPVAARELGDIAHQVLCKVIELTDLRSAIDGAKGEGILGDADPEVLFNSLHALLSRSDVAPWFSAGSEVRTEAAIIGDDGRTLRPDRVMLDGAQARVLDYKTGAPSDTHHEQVRGYMRLLGQLGFAHVQGALLYLGSGELIPVAS